MALKQMVAAAGVAAALAGAAAAHDGAMGVVKDRMDAMGAIKDANKTLRGIMRGRSDYDAGAVQAAAAEIEARSGAALTSMFPEGSLNPPTEAKPEVWQQWEDFEALALQMEHYARALGAAAENGLTAGGQGGGMTGGMATSGPLKSIEELSAMPAGDVYKLLGETCSACHTRFRIDKK